MHRALKGVNLWVRTSHIMHACEEVVDEYKYKIISLQGDYTLGCQCALFRYIPEIPYFNVYVQIYIN